MAIRLRKKLIHGNEYWYAVESVRVGGKPTTRHVAYLGKAENLIAAGTSRSPQSIRSRSHGVAAVLKRLADRLQIAQTIDRHVAQRRGSIATVGQTLVLAALGRAAHPTSKRGFAPWAAGTTLGRLFGVNIDKLTSAFFWDQMDKVSPQALRAIEAEIIGRAVEQFDVRTELLVYDTTNFFTYIASDNDHCDLPQRGKSKQRRGDLRQLALALLVSRDGDVPLGSYLYRGNRNDVSVFAEAFSVLRDQLAAMAIAIESITFVYDKGNTSKANQARMEGLDYVTSLVPSQHKELLELNQAQAQQLADGTPVWRVRKELWGREQSVVMLISHQLRRGQQLGLDQHLGKAMLQLERMRRKLLEAKRRNKRQDVEQRVAKLCAAAQLKHVLVVQIDEPKPGFFDLRAQVDMERYGWLCEHCFGRRLLVTNRHEWTSEQIVAAYRGQAHVERAFRTVKDPFHLALRPQYHWTDQKIQVHVFCCLMAYLLASLLVREARRAGFAHTPRHLLDLLEQVRLATCVQQRGPNRPGRPASSTQLETCDKEAMRLFRLFIDEQNIA